MQTLYIALWYVNLLAIPVGLFSPILFSVGFRAMVRILKSNPEAAIADELMTVGWAWGALVFFLFTLLLFSVLRGISQ